MSITITFTDPTPEEADRLISLLLDYTDTFDENTPEVVIPPQDAQPPQPQETKPKAKKEEPKPQEPKKEEPKQPEAKKEETDKPLTHADLQKAFLEFVGKNREAAVALLSEFGAKNLKTVPEDKLAEFKAKLEAANG